MAPHDIKSRESVRIAPAMIGNVIVILHANDCDEWAKVLEQKLAEITTWYDTKEALFSFGEVCDPKALGDLYVHEMEWKTWIAKIAELKRVCVQAFNELESTGPNQS